MTDDVNMQCRSLSFSDVCDNDYSCFAVELRTVSLMILLV